MGRVKAPSIQNSIVNDALFTNAPMGILIVGQDGKMADANPFAEKMFRYGKGELHGQPVNILVPENFRKGHDSHMTDFFSMPAARSMGRKLELTAARKDGTIFPVEICLAPYEQNGKILVVTYINDITERKKAAEMLKSEEQRIRLLIEHTPAAVAMFDTQMRYIIVSKRWLQDYGLKECDVIDKSHYEVFPDIPEHWKELHKRAFAGETLHADEEPFPRADGRTDWVRWELCPWYANNKIGGVILFTEVVTKRKEAEESLKELNKNLDKRVKEQNKELIEALAYEKRISEMKSRFVTMASHEFRTPLSTILSSVSIIEQYPLTEQQEKRAKHIDRIKYSVGTLTSILSDFLSLDKLDAGSVVSEAARFDLKEFMEQLLEDTQAIAKQGQTIKLAYAGDTNAVLDKNGLRNIVLNLLSNAIKYSKTEIELNCNVTDNEVTISITDHGIGIPEDEQKLMFTRFFRAKNVENIQGTGLGLNIAQRYVELMGGKIEFSSKLDEGTTFTVRLPQKNAAN